MTTTVNTRQPPAEPDILLEGKGLERTFMTGEVAVRALRGVDITLTRGELVVLLGHSGSGKSTLLNILGGLDRATAGTLQVRRYKDLTHATDAQLTRYRRRDLWDLCSSSTISLPASPPAKMSRWSPRSPTTRCNRMKRSSLWAWATA